MRRLLSKFGRELSRPWSSPADDPRQRDSLAWLGIAVETLALAAALLALTAVMSLWVVWVAAALAFFFGSLILVIRALKAVPAATRQMAGKKPYEFREQVGDLTDLDRVVHEGRRAIGKAHPDQMVIMERMKENPEVLRTFSRESRDGRLRFCGYYLLYPLKADAAAEILSERVRAASELSDGALCPNFEAAEYIYIGMILGIDKHSQPHVTDVLRRELAATLASDRIKRVFARPATDRGRALMDRYGFLPVGRESEIWYVTGPALKAKLLAERSSSALIPISRRDPVEKAPRQGQQDSGDRPGT